jgi:hypothetical protein
MRPAVSMTISGKTARSAPVSSRRPSPQSTQPRRSLCQRKILVSHASLRADPCCWMQVRKVDSASVTKQFNRQSCFPWSVEFRCDCTATAGQESPLQLNKKRQHEPALHQARAMDIAFCSTGKIHHIGHGYSTSFCRGLEYCGFSLSITCDSFFVTSNG